MLKLGPRFRHVKDKVPGFFAKARPRKRVRVLPVEPLVIGSDSRGRRRGRRLLRRELNLHRSLGIGEERDRIRELVKRQMM